MIIRIAAGLLAAAASGAAFADEGEQTYIVYGLVEVINGDTLTMTIVEGSIDGEAIEIDETDLFRQALTGGADRIRLHGIDAPESVQECEDRRGKLYRCGERATYKLKRLLGIAADQGSDPSPLVVCEGSEIDRYNRLIAKCWAGEIELNRYMVAEGLAVADQQYSADYTDTEDEAKAAKRGIWAGRFVMPWDWRKGERLP